jgi:hypothetical protein
MPDEVGARDALEALGDHGADAEELRPLRAQSRELPVPYSWPASTTSGHAALLVLHRRVVDAHLLAARRVSVTPPSTPGTIRS